MHLEPQYMLFPFKYCCKRDKIQLNFPHVFFLNHLALLVALCKGRLSRLANIMLVSTHLTSRQISVHQKINLELTNTWEAGQFRKTNKE